MSDTAPRPTGNSSWYTIKEWFYEPHDYEWIKHQRSSRAIQPIFSALIGVMTIIFGLSAFFKLIGPDTPPTLVGKSLSVVMITACIVVTACWFALPFPGRFGLLAYGIFADLGIGLAVLMVTDRDSGTFGCIIFAVGGTFATLFVSAKWLIAHVLWATTITAIVFGLAYQQGEVDTTTLLARATVLFGVVTLMPIFSHLAWRALYRDARDSDRDPLTGLYNRRGLDAAIAELLERARTREECLAFIVIDIDKFKLVNDVYGHSEGDHVIQRTASRLTLHFGHYGVIGRVGGEEYLAVISGAPDKIAYLINSTNAALSDDQDSIPTTVSVGGVIMPTDSKTWAGGAPAISLASNVADSLMYQAKTAGGNGLRTTEI
ncbi:GGDEF domain-containing protein [Rhodococcus sp. ARC_M6]|uniref:GGDEF domain-containing protein n=1 Tax=Rhodococcus sp. ARC_M6 TaxID=2928852 RepID=UPI001FB3EB8A|nr:GGDEF domain-containing protein [Rhodococcus sp. ARC_M6]MCJ0905785.1 GGDEF domain-containing protein [Rhodococcus sp. ARC_M6]